MTEQLIAPRQDCQQTEASCQWKNVLRSRVTEIAKQLPNKGPFSLAINAVNFSIMNESEIYHADFLKKEDLTGKWRFYWASLDCKGIYFHLEKTLEKKGNFQQFIEITSGSRCVLAKRRMYSFRFKLLTEEACYTLKCDSILQRHRWMYMINLVASGRPREPPPNSLNCVVITDATDSNTSNDDEKNSFNRHNNELKSSSFTRTFSFRKIKSWKNRNNSLPPARRLRKKENTVKENCKKTSYIDCSFNFAENLAYFDD